MRLAASADVSLTTRTLAPVPPDRPRSTPGTASTSRKSRPLARSCSSSSFQQDNRRDKRVGPQSSAGLSRALRSYGTRTGFNQSNVESSSFTFSATPMSTANTCKCVGFSIRKWESVKRCQRHRSRCSPVGPGWTADRQSYLHQNPTVRCVALVATTHLSPRQANLAPARQRRPRRPFADCETEWSAHPMRPPQTHPADGDLRARRCGL